MGWAATQLSPLSETFVAFSSQAPGPVLDIGGAPGLASLAALKAGAEVIANDLEAALFPSEARFRIVTGRFPGGLHFDPSTLGAVHASNVFHFLTGNQLDAGHKRRIADASTCAAECRSRSSSDIAWR